MGFVCVGILEGMIALATALATAAFAVAQISWDKYIKFILVMGLG